MYITGNQYRVNSYSRQAAVRYALAYAMKPNPAYRYFPLINDRSGDCANFVSQCLRAGGAPMTYSPGHSWWYNSAGPATVKDDKWAIPWAVANSLYWYLKIGQSKNLPGPKGLEVASPSQLEAGDVIFYEDNRGAIFHSAVVTGFSGSSPLVSHHSYEALNIPYLASWKAVRYHFMKISV